VPALLRFTYGLALSKWKGERQPNAKIYCVIYNEQEPAQRLGRAAAAKERRLIKDRALAALAAAGSIEKLQLAELVPAPISARLATAQPVNASLAQRCFSIDDIEDLKRAEP